MCIVAVNMSTMNVEYFHCKTTPNMPVSVAVRASMAVPGNVCKHVKTTASSRPHYVTCL